MEILFYLFTFLIISSIPLLIHYLKKPNHNTSIKDLYAEGLDMLVIGKRKSAYKIFKTIIFIVINIKFIIFQICDVAGDLLAGELNNFSDSGLYTNTAFETRFLHYFGFLIK